MKKRKTALLTAMAISLFLLLISAGAKIFTGRLGEINEIENNLTADVVPGTTDNTFDYPYINFVDLKTSADEKAQVYKPMFDESEYNYYISNNYAPDENMLTHQQAANKFGEAVKYLYGYTGHTNNPVVLAYDGDYGSDQFPQIYSLYYIDTQNQYVISGHIDPVSGRITKIKSQNRINISKSSGATEYLDEAVNDEIYGKIIEATLSDLKLLGYNETVETMDFFSIDHTAHNDAYENYIATVKISDGTKCVLLYCSEDSDYFELARFEYNW